MSEIRCPRSEVGGRRAGGTGVRRRKSGDRRDPVYHRGERGRAPWLFRVAGLEWFYRLLKEPRRWQRQMALPRFAMAALIEKLKQGKAETPR